MVDALGVGGAERVAPRAEDAADAPGRGDGAPWDLGRPPEVQVEDAGRRHLPRRDAGRRRPLDRAVTATIARFDIGVDGAVAGEPAVGR